MKHKSFRKRRVKKQQPSKKKQQNDNFFESQVQRKCEKCKDEDKKEVQKKSDGQSTTASKSFFGSYMNTIDSKGSSLSKNNRAFFESRMNDNFGDVKLHNDKESASAAKEIGAKAFAWQNHIVVNSEYYKEGSLEGKKLLAHELKHIQQQKNGKHIIQMMLEEDATEPATKEEEEVAEPTTEEGVQQTSAADSETMEKEAEQEEEMIMVPENIPDFQTFGKAFAKTAYANSVTFEGRTDATFDGGTGSTRSLSRTPSEDCVNCAEGDCWHYTGQLQIDYSVSTNITLPDVPEGLTECQHERVRNAIDNVLSPHEDDHVTAFNQYNGSVTLPIDYTGCSAGIQEYVENLHYINAASREARVQAASDALDPFHVAVDLDCEDESTPAPTPDAEQ
ncbi:hypothetical protein IWQ47_004370 [Aquimarina sp. EL_43]|uniref:eCIS core domain-containing protein n=1 Tax=unclassified Aquimarina TaxID=2627091 RepID=UPI0018CAFA82|nr:MULTISPECIES: DUF4157 domain-containing protein [unclassified Aquimarina]MBG6132800.1 hypothetical protein [Aquimarina sp. EL_35]MBG6153123.1 hypothetical protein [Aquimarina sp. EL_32]MBG6171279.1 hypothetical protein [Aquimarina sp. EL_43]